MVLQFKVFIFVGLYPLILIYEPIEVFNLNDEAPLNLDYYFHFHVNRKQDLDSNDFEFASIQYLDSLLVCFIYSVVV